MVRERGFETVAFTGEDADSDFRSGVAPLDEFFRSQAGQNQRRNVSRTWVLQRSGEEHELPAVLGFYTLTLGAVERESLPPKVGRKLSRYPVPVVIIGRLAVDERVRGRRIGERLLLDAQARALEIAEYAGGVGIIVDAKDASAAGFYEHYGYEVLEHAGSHDGPKRMFQAMTTLREAYES